MLSNNFSHPDIQIRKANRDDSSFIAAVVIEALGKNVLCHFPHMEKSDAAEIHSLMCKVVDRGDTLYSWRHALVAVDADGRQAGAIVSYAGDNYVAMRNTTFSLCTRFIDFDVKKMDLETVAGEYYLDSLAVHPDFRGKGIGRILLRQAMSVGASQGRTLVLACAPDNLNAKRMYESLGFRDKNHFFIFGEDYIRMTFIPDHNTNI